MILCRMKPPPMCDPTHVMSPHQGQAPDTQFYNRYLKSIATQIASLPSGDSMNSSLVDDIYRMRFESIKKGHKSEVWVAVYGFGNHRKKILAMRALRYATVPTFMYGSNTGESRWEVMLLIKSKDGAMQKIDDLCDKFRMSIGVVELGTYMGPLMLTCYQRIKSGTMMFGNIMNDRNKYHNQNFESFIRRKADLERMVAAEAEIGMPFNIHNMLSLHRTVRNQQIEFSELRAQIMQARRHLVDITATTNVVNSILDNANDFEHEVFVSEIVNDEIQGNARTRSIRHLDEANQSLHNLNSMLLRMHGSVDLTTGSLLPGSVQITSIHVD